MSAILDFSKEISDLELPTIEKLEPFTTSITFKTLTLQQIEGNTVSDYVLVVKQKSESDLLAGLTDPSLRDNLKFSQFVVSIWGGGSSGIRTGSTVIDPFATGGYSSGAIIRFPLDIDMNNHFAVIRIGKGGESFKLSEIKTIANGDFSYFQLLRSELPNAYQNSKYRNVASSDKKTEEVEMLISYGGGIVPGTDDIQQFNSTENFYSFNGANRSNTAVIDASGANNDPLDRYDHLNFYSPYVSRYDGYNSFAGLGGKHNGRLDADENTGAGGAGYLPGVSFEIDSKGELAEPRVGKGGNGACVIEYENSVGIEIYAIGYIYIDQFSSNLVIKIADDIKAINQTISIFFESKTYSLSKFVSTIILKLPDSGTATIQESKLKITLPFRWSIDTNLSSKKLLGLIGFLETDNSDFKTVQETYTRTMSLPILDVCLVEDLIKLTAN